MWTAVGLLFALTAVTVGAWGLRAWAPFAHDHPAIAWPKNVQPLVDFVETEAQLRFTSAVTVRFVADDAALHALLTPRVKTPEAQTRLDADAAMGRALGFWSGPVDLGAATDSLRDASSFAAAYLSGTDTMAVEAKNGDATLPPAQRADIIFTLTSILLDQRFHTIQRLAAIHDTARYEALAGVALGQMAFLHDRYIRRFNSADRAAYDTATQQRSTAFEAKVTDAPAAFRALRIESQLLGRGFVTALHATDPDGFTTALTSDMPTALDQLEMPTARYARRDATEVAHATPLPVDAHLLEHRQLGPFGLYIMLAGGLPATEALTASDGWGNDAVTIYRLGTQVCTSGRVVADTGADADRIERGLNAWGHARPKEAAALVGRRGTTLLFSACDPGTTLHQPTPAPAVFDQFFGRADELTHQLIAQGQPARSECIAVSAYARYVARDVSSAVLDRITADCDSSI
jgi:hypothetical protein